MLRPVAKGFASPVRGIGIAIRARSKEFLAVTAGVFVLSLFLPIIVLSLARKPWDYFTFNPGVVVLRARKPKVVGLPSKLT